MAESLQESLDLAIWRFESGKTKSPWYQMHRLFYNGIVPKGNHRINPWDREAVFEKGFKSVYSQKSYWYRPGFWLVLKFRENKAGRDKEDWVRSQIPESRIGFNVPIPVTVTAKWKLEWVDEALAEVEWFSGVNGKRPGKCLEYLNDVRVEAPELFSLDNNVFLWEKLAFTFEALGDMKEAEYCLRCQAEFQPGCADAFLNLGNFFHQRGMIERAIAAYEEGLKIDPEDEFIYANLSSLYHQEGQGSSALQKINQAILKNPRRGLNFKIKGDIHLERGELDAALCNYYHALKRFDYLEEDMIMTTSRLAAGIHRIKGEYEEALKVLGEAFAISLMCDHDVEADIAQTHWEMGNEDRAKAYAESVLFCQPDNGKMLRLLADYYEKKGDAGKAKWYRKRYSKLEWDWNSWN